ncbi:MAG: hypothetical protein NVS3B5_05860 [Sphingomicrobium sp.]
MNYYEILGVSTRSEAEVIDAAYRAMMKKYHPDKFAGDVAQAGHRTRLINEAYATLRDPKKRAAYDRAKTDSENDRAKESQPPQAAPPKRQTEQKPGVNRDTYRSAFFHPLTVMTGLVLLVLLLIVATGHRDANANFAPESGPNVATIPAQVAPSPPMQQNLKYLPSGQYRTFCITNRTKRTIYYSVSWDKDDAGKNEIGAGREIVNSSSRDEPEPAVTFRSTFNPYLTADKSTKSLSTPASIVSDKLHCSDQYSFQYVNTNFYGDDTGGEEDVDLYDDHMMNPNISAGAKPSVH